MLRKIPYMGDARRPPWGHHGHVGERWARLYGKRPEKEDWRDADVHGPPQARRRAHRRGGRRRPQEGRGDPGRVRSQVPQVLVQRKDRRGLLPRRSPEQGSGRGRAPRSTRPGRRRDNRGRGRRGLGGANTRAHLPGRGVAAPAPIQPSGSRPFALPFHARSRIAPVRHPPDQGPLDGGRAELRPNGVLGSSALFLVLSRTLYPGAHTLPLTQEYAALVNGGSGTSRDQKQPTEGCTSEAVTLYEAYVDVVDY